MVLSYIASSWHSYRSSRKTPSEVSPQSRDDNADQPERTPDAQSDTFINESAAALHNADMNGREEAGETHRNDPTPKSSSRATRKERQKKRRRRTSLDTSLVSPESESGDVASIPYRADEQAERNAFLAKHKESLVQDEEVTEVSGGTGQDNSIISVSPSAAHTTLDQENRKGMSDSIDGTVATGKRPSLKLAEKGSRIKYPCPGAAQYDCQQVFSMLSAAKRHMKNVHLQEKFSCSACDKLYTRADALQHHLLTHSAEELTAAGADGGAQIGRNIPEGEKDPTALVQSNMLAPPTSSAGRSDAGFIGINTGVDSRSKQEHISNATAATGSPISVTESPVKLQVAGQAQESRSGLKRKRRSADTLVPNTEVQASKRQKRGLVSPPTSNVSEHIWREPGHGQVNGSSPKSSSDVISGKDSKTGNLNGFVRPWLPGSKLYHPAFNPRSPRKTSSEAHVVIPESSNAGSTKQTLWKELVDTSQETPLAGKKRKSAVYSSAKGKQRAEPDVDYSSPTHLHRQNITANIVEDEPDAQEQEQIGMATTVARKSSALKKPKPPVEPDQVLEDTMTDSDSQVTSEDERTSERASPSGDVYLCQECHRKFPSRALLRKHESRKDVHKLVIDCEDCNKTFGSREMLKRHQQELGHGDGTGFSGRKGPFSAAEINKLCRWRDKFCQEHDINHVDFNNMMTDSLRRHKGFVWPYRFISKADFLQEYYDILPSRNRRSMHRYRERAFQNVASNLEWTQEDDEELADLIKEIGPKWVEIGQRMSRTSDSVNQRWRNKVQYRGRQNDGEWLKAETQQLLDAVNQVKRESGISLDPNADIKMPWDSVSKKMKGKRTAQQCSNKWRLMHVTRKNGVFLRSDGNTSSRSNSGTPLPVSTPSKMSKRLAGATPSNVSSQIKFGRRPVSDVFVHESDDEILEEYDHAEAVSDKRSKAQLQTDPALEPEVELQDDDIQQSPSESNSAAVSPEDLSSEDAKESADELSEADTEEDAPKDESPDYRDESNQSQISGNESEGDIANRHSTSVDGMEKRASDENDSDDLMDEIVLRRSQHENGISRSSQSHASEADTDDGSVGLPANPFPARTPRNDPTISQAFYQTQANTSAVRAPRGGRQTQSQPVRPSPDVPVQLRPVSTTPQQPVFQSSQYNDHGASSDSSSSGEEGSVSDSSSDDTDNDTMVQDTRRESFLQSLRSQLSQRNQLVVPRSSQTPKKRVDWAQALKGQAHADEESSSSSNEG